MYSNLISPLITASRMKYLHVSLGLFTSRKTRNCVNRNSPIKTEWRNMNLPSHLHGEVARVLSLPVLPQDPMMWNRNLIEQLSSRMNFLDENQTRFSIFSRVGLCVPSLTRCTVGDLSSIQPQRLFRVRDLKYELSLAMWVY